MANRLGLLKSSFYLTKIVSNPNVLGAMLTPLPHFVPCCPIVFLILRRQYALGPSDLVSYECHPHSFLAKRRPFHQAQWLLVAKRKWNVHEKSADGIFIEQYRCRQVGCGHLQNR